MTRPSIHPQHVAAEIADRKAAPQERINIYEHDFECICGNNSHGSGGYAATREIGYTYKQ